MLGWSQDQLADKSRVAKATIANFEAGKRAPYERTLDDLEKALKIAGIEFTNGDQQGLRLTRPFVTGDYVKAVQIDPNPRISVRRDAADKVVSTIAIETEAVQKGDRKGRREK